LSIGCLQFAEGGRHVEYATWRIASRVRAGVHEKLPPMSDVPRLHENSQTMSLSFEGTLIQSCMRLADPDDLVLDYTRTMMGALLFNPQPRRVLMIGLGGGSMLKYLHRHVPGADLTVVEISQEVIDLRLSHPAG